MLLKDGRCEQTLNCNDNSEKKNGFTALHYACEHSNSNAELVKVLPHFPLDALTSGFAVASRSQG